MVKSSNGNSFRVTGPLYGEFTGQRWILRTKASGAEHWCLLWSAPWINRWVNNREAGDLRRHRAHYDVIVMYVLYITRQLYWSWLCNDHPKTEDPVIANIGLFAQQPIQTNNKEYIKIPHGYPFEGNPPATSGFGLHRSPEDSPHKGPNMYSFGVFLVVSFNKLLNKQSSCRWFETPRRSCMWRHCNKACFHWWLDAMGKNHIYCNYSRYIQNYVTYVICNLAHTYHE